VWAEDEGSCACIREERGSRATIRDARAGRRFSRQASGSRCTFPTSVLFGDDARRPQRAREHPGAGRAALAPRSLSPNVYLRTGNGWRMILHHGSPRSDAPRSAEPRKSCIEPSPIPSSLVAARRTPADTVRRACSAVRELVGRESAGTRRTRFHRCRSPGGRRIPRSSCCFTASRALGQPYAEALAASSPDADGGAHCRISRCSGEPKDYASLSSGDARGSWILPLSSGSLRRTALRDGRVARGQWLSQWLGGTRGRRTSSGAARCRPRSSHAAATPAGSPVYTRRSLDDEEKGNKARAFFPDCSTVRHASRATLREFDDVVTAPLHGFPIPTITGRAGARTGARRSGAACSERRTIPPPGCGAAAPGRGFRHVQCDFPVKGTPRSSAVRSGNLGWMPRR